ncbi:translation initiation factor IF-2 domain protein [Streptococcus pyogenes MGAS2111]|nr:translation initiation factor IF-2 domain protein [Streptococcus pyogenes MGAS2111]
MSHREAALKSIEEAETKLKSSNINAKSTADNRRKKQHVLKRIVS